MKILIVDDELVSREKLQKIMDTLGQSVVVENGEEALRVATSQNPPDLILLDIIMPGMDGYEVCRKLKANRKTSNIPVIFISVRGEENDEAQGLELGAVDYITKPFSPSIVKARVRTHLELKKHRNHIEEMVNERTVELKKATQEMRVEIAERKQAEEALRESEAQKAAILDGITTNLAFVNENLEILWANKAAADSVNRNIDEIFGHKCHELWADPNTPCDDCPTLKAFKTKRTEQAIIQTPDGTVWDEKGEPVFDGKGRLIGAIEIAHNITPRARAEEALRESEKNYRSILESIREGYYEVDISGNLTFFNDSMCKILGRTRDELLGMNNRELSTPESAKKVYQIYNRVYRTGVSINITEYEVIRKDGDVRVLEASVSLMRDLSGRPIGFHGIMRDVTARKRAAEALRESEEKYRLLIENATDAIFIAQDEVSKFANPKAEEMTGYSAEELTKIPLVEFIHPEDRDMVIERHIKRLKGEETSTIHFRVLNRSGEEFSVELNVALIDWEGRPAILSSLRDITAQKKLEAKLQQAQKMEAIGTLAGGIAHDFNNLLMAIQGRTSIMLMNKDSSHSDFGHLRGIEGHVESAADLTKQLLGFARGGKYEVRSTDLNELIKKENRMFGRTKKEIVISGKYEENLWSVEIDRGQIEQVLLNLYVNAWQAMPGGGNLILKTENVSLDRSDVKPFSIEHGRYVRISFTDTGVGMDKATRERIFDPFFTTKETGRGTGLGLASAYGIINNHGGLINVYSEKGHGTTFNIYLPASEKEVIKEKESTGDKVRGSETVLFVDDEDMITEVAEELFEELGYKVLIARGGKEAVEIYEKNKERIDIVILDMIMPDMSGGETYDRLKDIDPKVNVLLSSGYSINGRATEILDRGCNGFIQKPFNMEQLSQKIKELLDKK